jgi:hypothetical protein
MVPGALYEEADSVGVDEWPMTAGAECAIMPFFWSGCAVRPVSFGDSAQDVLIRANGVICLMGALSPLSGKVRTGITSFATRIVSRVADIEVCCNGCRGRPRQAVAPVLER